MLGLNPFKLSNNKKLTGYAAVNVEVAKNDVKLNFFKVLSFAAEYID